MKTYRPDIVMGDGVLIEFAKRLGITSFKQVANPNINETFLGSLIFLGLFFESISVKKPTGQIHPQNALAKIKIETKIPIQTEK